MFIRHGREFAAVTSGLRFVIVDELHAFMGTERGMQLQSLLDRADWNRAKFLPRIALSATLGDLNAAAAYLRPHKGVPCAQLSDAGDGSEIRMQVKAYIQGAEDAAEPDEKNAVTSAAWARLTDDLFGRLRGQNNLAFANSRAKVEILADRLRTASEQAHVPNEFYPHHSALSKELREFVEHRLRDDELPTTAICTSTLELGIDIGHVASIAQVGAPPGVASLKQRLGRSGRRVGTAQTLRQYVIVRAVDPESPLSDLLRLELVQTIATIELLLRGLFEPPVAGDLHLSTLVQQLLSTIYQTGGVSPAEAYERLISKGAFTAIEQSLFTEFLRSLGSAEVISQAHDGTLLPGRVGEKIAEHYTFYAAFASSEEYKLVTESRTLGTVPINNPLVPGGLLIFAGRRWKIISVDDANKTVVVISAGGGLPPMFDGTGRPVGELVRQEMRRVLADDKFPVYLDATAARELSAARTEFRRLGLDCNAAISHSGGIWLVLWEGDRVLNTLDLALRAKKKIVERSGPFIGFDRQTMESVRDVIVALATDPPVDAIALAETVQNLLHDKHDQWLDRALLRRAFAARSLDLDGLARLAHQVAIDLNRSIQRDLAVENPRDLERSREEPANGHLQ